jgi:GNAT superfamily N-acetyltransferase
VFRWLGRVGVIRNHKGEVIAALSLQLPGDIAAYESLMYRSCSDVYNVLNPLDSSTISLSADSTLGGELPPSRRVPSGGDDSSHGDEDIESAGEGLAASIPPEFFLLGIFHAFRFRYKHAIVCDHVCPPGEAYIDFLCVGEGARKGGAGTRLMRWAEQSAERLGCGRIALSVWGMDRMAQTFYENLGECNTLYTYI